MKLKAEYDRKKSMGSKAGPMTNINKIHKILARLIEKYGKGPN